MKHFKENCTELVKNWFEGEVTVTKLELWLALTVCMLAGIVYGLCKAPMTHGMMIGCNNGSSFGCDSCRKKAGKAEKEEPKREEEENPAGKDR